MINRNALSAVPTLLTLGNLLCGLAALALLADGGLLWPAALVFVSAALDALDGYAARALKVSTRQGAVLDSLADVVAFGVAPAVLLANLCRPAALVPWAAAAWLLCAVALRLARFTAGAPRSDRARATEGLPCPAAAMTIAAVAIALYWANWRGDLSGVQNLVDWLNPVLPAAAAGMGVLMLTRVEYPRPQEWVLEAVNGAWPIAIAALAALALFVAGGYAPLLACGLFVSSPLVRTPVRLLARARRSAEM